MRSRWPLLSPGRSSVLSVAENPWKFGAIFCERRRYSSLERIPLGFFRAESDPLIYEWISWNRQLAESCLVLYLLEASNFGQISSRNVEKSISFLLPVKAALLSLPAAAFLLAASACTFEFPSTTTAPSSPSSSSELQSFSSGIRSSMPTSS